MTDDLWSGCTVPCCVGSSWARGLCIRHYQHWRRHGDPLAGKDWAPRGAPRAFIELAIHHEGDDCLAWPYGRDGSGYGTIRVDGVRKSVHRLVCEAVNGPPTTPKHEVAHLCGRGHLGCVNPRHLRWATHQENMADKVRHGTSLKGERNPSAKLTDAERLEIRGARGQRSPRELADLYGVSPSVIYRAQKNSLQ